MTFLADYWIGGLDPFYYHLTSVFIHAANAFLLCLVLRLVLPLLLRGALGQRGTNLLALGVATVWAVHPVHSAAVAYISGTADTLAMLFCLTAILLCEQAYRATHALPRLLCGSGAFLGLLLGLCAKEIASVWLLLFLGYLFFGRTGTTRRARWTTVAGALLALAFYVGLRHLPPAPPPPPFTPTFPPKGVLMLRALGDYGSLLLFPKDLFMERQVFASPGLANAREAWFYHTLFFGGFLVLFAFGLGAWWTGRGQTLRRVGIGWFLAGFLPISNLFQLNATVAEHWLYLPSIGFFLFLAGIGVDVLPPLLRSRRAVLLTLALGFLTVSALGLRTWVRTFDWLDELTLFRQTIADGGDVPRARAALAVAYRRQGMRGKEQAAADDQAIAVLRDVVARYPKVVASRVNLATALAKRGELTEARALLEAAAASLAVETPPGDQRETVITIQSLDVLAKEDPTWPARREALFTRGLREHPDAWDLTRYVVQSRAAEGNRTEALRLARQFAEAHWWHGPAWIVLGRLEAEAGDTAAALSVWQQASRLDVHDAEAFADAAAFCVQNNRLAEARRFQAEAVSRQPGSPRQHVQLARILARQGDEAGARAQVELAQSLVETARTDR